MADFAYRTAALDDAAAIHELLLRLAPEIPLLVDTLEREEALYAQVRNYARSGESRVATDAAGRIVACALLELVQHGRHYAEQEVLELRHIGVAPAHRRQGIFSSLMAQILDRMLPVVTTVNPQNRSDIVRLLEQRGFHANAGPGGEYRLRWMPGA